MAKRLSEADIMARAQADAAQVRARANLAVCANDLRALAGGLRRMALPEIEAAAGIVLQRIRAAKGEVEPA